MRRFVPPLPHVMSAACAGLLLLGGLAARPAGAGPGGMGDPDEIAAHVRGANLQLRGFALDLRGARWVSHRRPAAPLARLDALRPPPGGWTDLALDLDGPVALTLEGPRGPVTWQLDLGEEWTIPLEDPDAQGPLQLSLALPAWAAAQGDLTPDSPGHDRIAAAVRDGAVLTAR